MRVLTIAELSFVAGGDYGGGGGDAPTIDIPDDFWSDVSNSWELTDNNGQVVADSDDIIVTAPFSRSEVESMNSEAEWMTDGEVALIGAGVGYAGVVAELGAGASAAAGAGTSLGLNHLVQDKMTDMNFNYIYQRDLQIKNGTYVDPSTMIP